MSFVQLNQIQRDDWGTTRPQQRDHRPYCQEIELLEENIAKLTEVNDIKSQLIEAKESENALLKQQIS